LLFLSPPALLLFVLFDRLRELRLSLLSPVSSPASVLCGLCLLLEPGWRLLLPSPLVWRESADFRDFLLLVGGKLDGSAPRPVDAGIPLPVSSSSSSSLRLPFRRMPLTAFEVEICRFWFKIKELLPVLEQLLLPLGSSKTTDVRLAAAPLLVAPSLDSVSDIEQRRSTELTDRLDSAFGIVLPAPPLLPAVVLFWMAYLRSDEALGDSRLLLLMVPVAEL
jgi:hypothetical protein